MTPVINSTSEYGRTCHAAFRHHFSCAFLPYFELRVRLLHPTVKPTNPVIRPIFIKLQISLTSARETRCYFPLSLLSPSISHVKYSCKIKEMTEIIMYSNI